MCFPWQSRETGADFSVSRSIQKNPMKKFAEATLGNTVNNGKLGGFLNYGRKVLSFSAVWDDRQSMYGELLQYQILFYLADDQVRIRFFFFFFFLSELKRVVNVSLLACLVV
jgi:hypothetical protein